MTRQQLDKFGNLTDNINEMYDKAYQANKISSSIGNMERFAYWEGQLEAVRKVIKIFDL